jgi:hypothetical protein
MSVTVKRRVCPKGHPTKVWDVPPHMVPPNEWCSPCLLWYSRALCTTEEPPKPTKVAKPAAVKPAALWQLCGGCGELFQPSERKQKVCGPDCSPLEVEETRRAREHAEKVRAGVLE